MKKIFVISIILSASVFSQAAFSQDIIDQSPKRALGEAVDWDRISIPPSDPYTLAYTPPKPDDAKDITDENSCQSAGGTWAVKRNYNENHKLFGCEINHKAEGRWFFGYVPLLEKTKYKQPIDEAAISGYVWFVDDKEEGESVLFNMSSKAMKFTKTLHSYHQGQLDGAIMEWNDVGTLTSVLHYSDNKFNGETAAFDDAGKPLYIGAYTNDKPTGEWKVFDPALGSINYVKKYDKVPPEELLSDVGAFERLVWTEEYNPMFNKKVIEGYRLERIDSDPKLPGTRYGTQVYYDLNGDKWLDINFKRDDILSDDYIKKVCDQWTEYSFDHAARTLYCKDKQDYTKTIISFYPYGKGGISCIDTMDAVDSDTFRREEFHPNGDNLTDPPSYLISNKYGYDVPEGKITFIPSTDQKNEEKSTETKSNRFEMVSTVLHGTGVWTRYWPNGNIREQGRFNNGKRDGEWVLYAANGSRTERFEYSDGVIDGMHERWFGDGMPDYSEQLVKGKKHGWTRGYYTLGGVGWELEYDQGRFVGTYREYTGTGATAKEENFSKVYTINGEKSFPVTLFYTNGKVRARGYDSAFSISQEKNGTWSLFLENGDYWRDVFYVDDEPVGEMSESCSMAGGKYVIDEIKREEGCYLPLIDRENLLMPDKIRFGRWKWWDEKGAVQREGELKLGHLYGTWRYYYPGGKPGLEPDPDFLMLEGSFDCDRAVGEWNGYYLGKKRKFTGGYDVGGLETGKWTTYFENGNVASVGEFIEGKRIGKWQWFYDNAQVKDEGEYTNGLETGTWRNYYQNGQKAGEGEFVNGKREGLWKWWREDGTLWRETNYVGGIDQSVNAR